MDTVIGSGQAYVALGACTHADAGAETLSNPHMTASTTADASTVLNLNRMKIFELATRMRPAPTHLAGAVSDAARYLLWTGQRAFHDAGGTKSS